MADLSKSTLSQRANYFQGQPGVTTLAGGKSNWVNPPVRDPNDPSEFHAQNLSTLAVPFPGISATSLGALFSEMAGPFAPHFPGSRAEQGGTR